MSETLPSWLTHLEQALLNEFHSADRQSSLERRDSLEKALKVTDAGTAAYLIRPKLLLSHYFFLDPDLVIHDDYLGSLGLVYGFELTESAEQTQEEMEKWIRKRVDEATYARHLLVVEAESLPANEPRLPRTIELVLVIPERQELAAVVGQTLREIARGTSYLHAIGINLLLYRGGGFHASDLRRAFAWMLRKTRAWYRRALSEEVKTYRPRRLAALELFNYRLPGRRSLRLAGDSRVHLLHGHNGSGKSSLVEALELVTTGRVERLQDANEERYDRIICHRAHDESQSAPAKVTLHYRRGKAQSFSIVESGIEGQVDPSLTDYLATTFRLDQTVMDRLARSGDRQRAAIFLSSFFPGEGETHERSREAQREAEKSLETLPVKIQQAVSALCENAQDPIEAVLQYFRWLDHPGDPLPKEACEDLLPLPMETLERLVPLAPEIQPILALWTSTSPPTLSNAEVDLRKLDEALQALQGRLDSNLRDLQAASQALTEKKGWYVDKDQPRTVNRHKTLDEWLELCALADLAERQHQISQTLFAATQAGWTPQWDGFRAIFLQFPVTREQLERLKDQAATWAQERDDRFRQLSGSATSTQSGTTAAEPPQEKPPPSLEQIAALDRVGSWLPQATPSSIPEPLGRMIAAAIRKSEPATFGGYSVGYPGWTEPILPFLDSLREAAQELRNLGTSSITMNGIRRLGIFREVKSKYQAAAESAMQVSKALGEHLAEVSQALNELMALFTPARWAYSDICLSYRLGEEGSEVGFETQNDQARAELRFNTAELNLFTVALFFLCAVRSKNPLRLLVLDDPLQNMDELTVTTLARGLARVVKLMPPEWDLLLLFHGEDDLERFRREIPAALYKLPWLSPAERLSSEGLSITGKAEGGKGFQKLDGFLQDRDLAASK